MASERSSGVSRSKEGVPCWTGDAGSFQEYEELSLAWEQSVPVHRRYLCGPKLVNELQGTARRFITGKKPDWLSFNGGVSKLMEHLRQHLGIPQLPEMTSYLNQYFKQSRRKRNEPMNDYITRKSELYARSVQSLARVQKSFGGGVSTRTSSTTGGGTAWSTTSQGGEEDFHDVREEAEAGQEQEEEEGEEGEWQDWWNPGWRGYGNGWHSGWSDWRQDSWWSATQRSDDSSHQDPVPELLPDFVQGWLLLQDAGLETSEKNMVTAALKNDYSVARVAQELRNQWVDDDLRRHDQAGRMSGWMTYDDMESESNLEEGPDMAFLADSGLTEEGMMLMEQAEDEAQHALTTLREARQKQHQVKMSRQYFRTSFRGGGQRFKSTGSFTKREGHRDGGTSSVDKCLGCGGPHRTSQCPKKSGLASVAEHEETAPFVCFADGGPEALVADGGEHSKLTTQEAVQRGMAVVDGGATKTLGSVKAVEHIMSLNQKKRGDHGIEKVDTSNTPTFGFGNSSSDRCLSTAHLKIQAAGREGQLKIHTLDRGEGPVLFSIDALRSLGAIVDYEHDLICFRRLQDQQLIPVARSCTGHQLLPLTKDWYEGAIATREKVPSLKDLI